MTEAPSAKWRPFLADHAPLGALVAGYLLTARWVEARGGPDLTPRSIGWELVVAVAVGSSVILIVAGAFGVVFLLGRAVPRLSRSTGPGGLVRSTWVDYRRHLTFDHLAGLFTVYALLYLLLSQFLAFKSAIPEFSPFAWDATFMELDRALHFGRDPWRLLHPALGWTWVTAGLDRVYYVWFGLNALFFAWMGWTRPSPLRRRFFLTYFLLWIVLGTVGAIIFSSAGPVYFDRVTGEPGPYMPLLDYLHQVDARVPLLSLDVQESLWAGYVGVASQPVEGIAAMPSLHVAVPVLLALAGRRVHPALGWAMSVYALLILLGSIHLGWHYAVDGYAALATVPLLWWLVGRGFDTRSGSSTFPGSSR